MPPDDAPPLTRRAAGWAILLGLVLIVLTALAVRNTELVTGQYVSTGVPPLPAFGALVVLSVLRPLLARFTPRLALSRAQILLVYAMLTVGVVLSGLYHVRGFLPTLTALGYWGKPGTRLDGLDRFLPAWWAPRDPDALRRYWEGGGDRTIPWRAWALPLAAWSVFFAAIFVGVFSLTSLVQRRWTRDERLSFPLLTLPLALTDPSPARKGRGLFWLGFGLAALFNGINIVHTLNPSVPAPGFSTGLNGLFPDRPWSALEPVRLYLMLDAIGLGYFIPLDLSFSIWFFYVANRLWAVAGLARGVDTPGFPFTQEQSAGGYLAVGLLLLWGLRRAVWTPQPDERRAWWGLAVSAVGVLGFCRLAGLSLWLSAPYFGLIALMTLVYARIRAETGAPFQFLYPFGLHRDLILNTISVPQALLWGGPGSLTLLGSLSFLSNHHHPLEQAAYQLDATKLAQDSRIPRRTLCLALALAVAVGLAASVWAHLSAYYDVGANLIPSAGGFGEWRAKQARQAYESVAAQISLPPPRNADRLWAVLGGFCVAGGLGVLRSRWVGSPLHPLGFLIANAFGDTSTSWFPMLVAWAAKALVLKFGGLPLYRRGIPFFLGLTIGHFCVGGLLWPCLALLLPREVGNAYHLLFGE